MLGLDPFNVAAIAPPIALLKPFSGLRVIQVLDDHLEPNVRRLDYVLVAPVEAYHRAGHYVLEDAFGNPTGFLCSAGGTREAPKVTLRCLNPRYPEQIRSMDDFADAVIGKVVATMRVVDPDLIRTFL